MLFNAVAEKGLTMIKRNGLTAEDTRALEEAVRRHPATVSKLLNNRNTTR